MKILYWIQSDGMGHALRSLVVVRYLESQWHTVQVVTSGKVVWFFRDKGFQVSEVTSLSFYYRNNKVSYIMTGLKSLLNSPKVINKCIIPLTKIILKFKPDVIFTDFELFTAKAGLLMDIPVISIDNISLVFLAKLPFTFHTLPEYSLARITAQWFIQWAHHYCVTSFFPAELLHPEKHWNRVTFVPPIVRDEIQKSVSTLGDHIIVYQSTKTNKKLIPTLHNFPRQKFILYGFDEERVDKNIQYKKFSSEVFIDDLSLAKAVMTNGGFTLISEALYLHKPLLCMPIERHYEQSLNSEMVMKMGYGVSTPSISEEVVKDFIVNIPQYQKNLSQYSQQGNKLLFERLDILLKWIV